LLLLRTIVVVDVVKLQYFFFVFLKFIYLFGYPACNKLSVSVSLGFNFNVTCCSQRWHI